MDLVDANDYEETDFPEMVWEEAADSESYATIRKSLMVDLPVETWAFIITSILFWVLMLGGMLGIYVVFSSN